MSEYHKILASLTESGIPAEYTHDMNVEHHKDCQCARCEPLGRPCACIHCHEFRETHPHSWFKEAKSTDVYHITVDGKLKYPNLTATEADIYWKGMNIFGKHTAALYKNKKKIDTKSERQ